MSNRRRGQAGRPDDGAPRGRDQSLRRPGPTFPAADAGRSAAARVAGRLARAAFAPSIASTRRPAAWSCCAHGGGRERTSASSFARTASSAPTWRWCAARPRTSASNRTWSPTAATAGAAAAPTASGQHAVTHVRVVEQLGEFTLVECRLETGRTHQVRIHLGERGTPLCGERIYDRPLHGRPLPDASGGQAADAARGDAGARSSGDGEADVVEIGASGRHGGALGKTPQTAERIVRRNVAFRSAKGHSFAERKATTIEAIARFDRRWTRRFHLDVAFPF